MLKEKDLDIVLIGTPDHWHALHGDRGDGSGGGCLCAEADQRRRGRRRGDGGRGSAGTNRVVQVGTQRKSTPHLVECKKNVIDAGLLGQVGHVEICCYYHMRANGNPPTRSRRPITSITKCGPAPRRCGPTTACPHRRWWRTFMEYGNGIIGDMCIHMLDTVRWMLGLGWPKRIDSTGGIYVQKDGKSNISDTQIATFEYPGLNVVWTHRTWGNPPDPKYPWAMTLHGDKGCSRRAP